MAQGHGGALKSRPIPSALDADCWHAWCDGSALPNPGPIGVGVRLCAPDGTAQEYSGRAGAGCNNEAELIALCRTLEMALQHKAERLVVYSDSDVAVQYVNGTGATKIERLQVLVLRAQALREQFATLQLIWVPRHRNPDADRLARLAFAV